MGRIISVQIPPRRRNLLAMLSVFSASSLMCARVRLKAFSLFMTPERGTFFAHAS